MISTDLAEFITRAEDHYWGSLERERDLILHHLYNIVIMIIKDNYKEYNQASKLTEAK